MNSPSPFVQQGSNLEQQNQARSTLKMKIFCALGINVAVLLVLLMQGCKREQPQAEPEQFPVFTETNPPPMEMDVTNAPYATTVDTNSLLLQVPPVETPPPPPATTSEYTILKGDTFSTIAPRFGVTVKELQAANATVDPARLQIGKKIIIPPPSAAGSSPDTIGFPAPGVDGAGLYKVKSGDTLSRIARAHHTTVKAIQSANNLIDSRIKVGQLLKLPANSGSTGTAPAVPLQ